VDVNLALAFGAGLLSFASPCVLALVPVYVAFLGESAGAVTPTGASPSAIAAELPAARTAVLGQALLFVLGFSSVFVLLGTPLGLLGEGLFRDDLVRHIAGVVVVAIGILTTGIFGPVLERWSMPTPSAGALPAGRVARATALGAFVAVGWTPCIGPVLGAILTAGMSAQSAPASALLLVGYSIGLAVPFIAAALALPRMRPVMATLRRHHRSIQVIAGLFIVAMGILIYLDAFARMASLFSLFL
jgi:cytochrome c-type biogenesis protein